MLDFLSIGLADILDILFVTLLIFFLFRWMKDSYARNVFYVVVSFYILRVIASALGMKMITTLMDMVLNLGLLALIVIFQPEVRRFLINFGKRYRTLPKATFLGIFSRQERKANHDVITEICEACRMMSSGKVGALIVIARNDSLEEIVQSGDVIDARVNRRLLLNLFFKNSPLHDGAVIISKDRIVAARCTLPITQREDIPPQFGMRHKAAVGVSEVSDAVVAVVSEQTGHVSFASDGHLSEMGGINELRLNLDKSCNG
ncbi:MAG: diadenylate cyclase CdaA [Bacteroidales bacterium]|nr:diadenylate cyclase CdaA [Bacteroidales bacterium]